MEFKLKLSTTLEQSQRLLELGLKPETADMVYHHRNTKIPALEWELLPHPPTLRGEFWNPQRISKLQSPFHKNSDGTPMTGEQIFDNIWGKDIPAWSLSRLLEILPAEIKDKNGSNAFCLFNYEGWEVSYSSKKHFRYESPIEACIRTIQMLIEKGQFNEEYLCISV